MSGYAIDEIWDKFPKIFDLFDIKRIEEIINGEGKKKQHILYEWFNSRNDKRLQKLLEILSDMESKVINFKKLTCNFQNDHRGCHQNLTEIICGYHLVNQNLDNVHYEPDENPKKVPDYLIKVNKQKICIEVKSLMTPFQDGYVKDNERIEGILKEAYRKFTDEHENYVLLNLSGTIFYQDLEIALYGGNRVEIGTQSGQTTLQDKFWHNKKHRKLNGVIAIRENPIYLKHPFKFKIHINPYVPSSSLIHGIFKDEVDDLNEF